MGGGGGGGGGVSADKKKHFRLAFQHVKSVQISLSRFNVFADEHDINQEEGPSVDGGQFASSSSIVVRVQ